ncbi:nwd2 [Moniliophthora roreri MCA 2997]|uniref:Nwd2 n=1 Tax=Moniliophthora roreri (strain MCA 2997) TaxID=1381753 RepID=V2X5N0_MONRO|nr:nwd2 [Moniliophthora roreri MCA 2997]
MEFNPNDPKMPSAEAKQYIRRYFIEKFTELRRNHPAWSHRSESWPTDNVIDQLVERANGQVIFTSILIKFLDTRDERPQDRLDAFLRIEVEHGSESPYSALDLLYRQIMSTCQRVWEKVQAILSLLITPATQPKMLFHGVLAGGVIRAGRTIPAINWRSYRMIELLLNLEKGEVATLLSTLHSVLLIPVDNESDIRFVHESFVEFLLDTNRSANYHILPLAEPEYCDRVAILLLGTLSNLTPHYPLFQSMLATVNLSSWKDALSNLQSNLMTYSCLLWHAYCTKVVSPSPDLLVALKTFNPYCVLAAQIHYNLILDFRCWNAVIDWAKTLGKSTKNFVKICESCTQGFRMAFPPTMSRDEALWRTFYSEANLCYEFDMSTFQTELLLKLYSVDDSWYWFVKTSPVFMILSAETDRHLGLSIPKDWVVVDVTKANGELFKKTSDLEHEGQRTLLHDIGDDTWESEWISNNNLMHLKLLLKKRWVLFPPKYDDLLSKSFSDLSYGHGQWKK